MFAFNRVKLGRPNVHGDRDSTRVDVSDPARTVCVACALRGSSSHLNIQLLFVVFSTILNRFQSIERVGVLRQRVIFFIKNRFQYQSASSLRFRVPPLDKLVLVLRDRMWMRLPVQVLVSGDVIQLFAGEPAPCRVRPIVRRADSDLFEDLDGELCIGEEWDRQLTSFTLSPLVQNEAFVELSPLKPAVSLQNKPTQAFFRVIEEPSLTLIDTVFGDALQRPQTMFANYARILRRTNFYLLLVHIIVF
jgi:hypothetical protein